MALGERSRKLPWWAARSQPWASEIVEASHTEALWGFGEYSLYTLMWLPQDHNAGRVGLCPVCAASRSANAFDQPERKKCPSCFGSRFEGGFRAQIIRPTIWADRNESTEQVERGIVIVDNLQAETTADFTMNAGDFIFRADSTRWQSEEKGEGILRTGFHHPDFRDSFRGSFAAALEDPTSISYVVPLPHGAVSLPELLDHSNFHIPEDVVALDVIRPNGYIL